MEEDQLTKFELALVNLECLSVARRESDWVFELSVGASLVFSVPWRIVSEGRILFADEDHGHSFGLSKPVDGEVIANKAFRGQSILKASVNRETGDLTLLFRQDLRVDAFNNSAGYEAWTAGCKIDGFHRQIIALGGGDVAIM